MRRILALLTSALFAGAALAETSSWSSKGEAGGAPTPQKTPGQKKPQKPAPAQQLPAAPAATTDKAAPAEGASSHAKGAPQGEDAAYEAFDQGRYLTALQLAMKAAESGDPQAHTLVGRLYAEGYGVAKDSALAGRWYARGAELGDPEAMFA